MEEHCFRCLKSVQIRSLPTFLYLFFFEPPTFENIFWKNCPNKIQDEKNKLIRKTIFSCIEEHKTTLNGFYEQHL